MSYSVSLEGERRNFSLKVVYELLVQGKVLGIEPDALVEFMAIQAQNMLNYKHNFNLHGHRVWVMRGFYPKSSLFFKLSICEARLSDGHISADSLSAKASGLRVKEGSSVTQWEKTIRFNGNDLMDKITDRMENAFFSANHKVDPIVQDKIMMPRCMSPKGMKLFRYEKPKKRRKSV
jgi:hypothetical protein